MKKITFSALLQLCLLMSFAQIKVQGLLTENFTNPIALGVQAPRFSWQLVAEKRNTMQTAYEINVTTDKGSAWKSGKISSGQSVQLNYAGSPLQSDQKYTWKVRVWDNNGKASPWSEAASFKMGLLNTADWKAKWIEAGYVEDSINRPAILFRNQFALAKKIKSATLYITAHGMYEVQLNGKRVGDAYLAPGWTSYNKRLQYQAYDVTNMLSNGNNVIGATVGNGWYRGFLAWDDNKNIYGKKLGLLAQVNVVYTDGTREAIVTDDKWKSTNSAIKSVEIYHGETFDAREEKNGWAATGYNDGGWKGVNLLTTTFDNLISTENEPVRKHETFKAIKVITTPSGEKVLDFGQNLVGWVIVKAKGNAGDKIVIKHAEILDKAGNFYTENLRAAKATATYILKGGAEETFEPHFTFYGFRYIKLENYPGTINPDNFTAVTLYSDMKPTGTFSSSNALVNQLQHNIQWGQRGNFLDVPTDCPQRDERLGWTGDAQAFSRTASFNFGVNNFFDKWMKDVAADQLADGRIPHVIPNVLGPDNGGSAGWADVATIIPWNMYLAYGDKKILETQYPSMKAWVKFMTDKSKNDLWNIGFHFGDWLFYRPFDDNDGRSAVTDKYLIAQCFYANSVQLLINTSKVLNKADDEATYTALLKRVKDAFLKEYVTPSGRLVSGTQTAYVLALNFDMLPENLRKQAAERLAENVKSYDTHLTTGFLGTPYLCHVLTRFGYSDIAYSLLLQQDYPSWLYPVKMGATTIWERWDGQKPDSTFQTPGMNSFNHYAYGAIGDWMYRQMVGLDTYEDGPGYKHIRVKPHVGGGFTNASASLQTYYGTFSSGWKTEDNKILMDVEIPANTTATIYVPATAATAVTENGKAVSTIADIKVSGTEEGYVLLQVGSGKYHFVITK
ncbi:family 78 glycoside hydrolase catalytic domain [Ferruginibacter paludis]|uniref:alpha-L-rhamnosidase n=1 Tax=Ferruginibacter paludis TaxID=1310417 RepID=UPI0025B57981|nr:alpha-L-rhamnosidase [Ferruginibacter paludis]MDN3657608.1 family 78 glycoside hydrolase catalytic domain [Ferruginibacter paludis]